MSDIIQATNYFSVRLANCGDLSNFHFTIDSKLSRGTSILVTLLEKNQ